MDFVLKVMTFAPKVMTFELKLKDHTQEGTSARAEFEDGFKTAIAAEIGNFDTNNDEFRLIV